MSTTVAARASDRILASYEAFPYDSTPVSGSNPDTFATVALLRGLAPPDVSTCRVLELGCGTGGNIISIAMGLPRSTFVGVDLSPRQIAVARELTGALELGNIRFEACSIDEIGDDFGTFDYIICHGVYSWVPPDVRAAILRVCSRNLAPRGIAYVSYNTYPGWHLRGMMRDLVMFHDRPDLPPAERVARGREMAEFVASSVPATDPVYAAIVREELVTLRTAGDSYFLHEELEPVNDPMYFTEFVRAAESAGLQYVGEADPFARSAALTREVRSAIRGMAADEIQFEQYIDFVCNRTFRKTLLCHAGLAVDPEPSASAVPRLHLRARCTVDPSAPEAKQPGVEVFRTRAEFAVTIEHPLVRAALHALIDAHPASLSFDELWERTGAGNSRGSDGVAGAPGGRDELSAAMLQSESVRLIELRSLPMVCAVSAGERPVASPLARLQARTGSAVANLANQTVELSPFDRVVLMHADGSRGAPELVEVVGQAFARGELDAASGPPPTRANLAEGVDRALRNFVRVALLVE